MNTTPKDDIKTVWQDLKTDIPKGLLNFIVYSWTGFLLLILILLGIAVWAGWYFSPWFYSL